MWTRLCIYAGLGRPYRFERAIPVMFAVLLGSGVVVAACWLAAIGELRLVGPRTTYFIYLAVLLVLVMAFARWPRLATALVVLAAIDFCWGVGSHVLQSAGIPTASLLPPAGAEVQRFRWHPLLQVVPISSLRFISSTGLSISHTSQGTRGREPTPQDLAAQAIVATFGGSTTYDIAVGEGDTWSDQLNAALGEGEGRGRFFVVNHGVPGYSTVEHVIQTAFYQNKFGRAPHCAIYYVGWNDLRNAHIRNLDPGYADFHLPSQVDALQVRRIGGSHVTFSPALTMAARFVAENIDSIQYSASPSGEPVAGDDPALEALYERNVRSISAINRERGIATLWVGQLLNRERLTGEGRYGWLPLVRDRDVWPLQQRFNAILERTARALGDTYIDIPPGSFGDGDFVDSGHFSKSGAHRFANSLAPVVRDVCR
ncbi:MAG: hypothetical protein ACHQK9_07985 [Reyranellales bacterium]